MTNKLTALIYTRVSSITQETHGSGNDSQEIRCREYAKNNDWEIGEVFRDAFTGAGDYMNRPEMRRLIGYIKKNKEKRFVIIFDDIKRLSRETSAFISLMTLFKALDVRVECLNHKLEDTPEGEFISTILAAQGQLERKQNARQVIQKTEAHLLNGDWPYKTPIGYIAVSVVGSKRKIASIDGKLGLGIKNGLQGFASGRFKNISELGRYFATNNYIRNTTRNGMYDKARSILQNTFYAGYINKPEKNILMVKGKHEAMITLEEYYCIQERLKKEMKGEKEYQMFRDEYELRQLVRCSDCGNKLKSGRSKGRTKYYDYYICRTKGCIKENTHIQTETLHNHLYRTLKSIESTEEVIDLGIESFNKVFEEVIQSKGLIAGEILRSITDIDNQINILITNLTKLTNESVLRGIESKIEELDLQKKILLDKKDKIVTLDNKSRTALNKMKVFLKSPYDTWRLCNAKQKRSLYRFIFSEDYIYDPKTESRTIPLSPLYAYFKELNENTPPERESIFDNHFNGARTKIRTWDRSSISRVLYQLSYSRICKLPY